MKLRRGTRGVLCGLSGLVLAAIGQVGYGAVTVSVSSQAVGDGSYDYEFTIVNTGPESIATVIVDGPPMDDNIAPSLGTPAGAIAVYGAPQGALVFLRGAEMLFDANTTTTGFTLNSLSPPESGPFQGFQAVPTAGEDIVGNVDIEGFDPLIFANGFE